MAKIQTSKYLTAQELKELAMVAKDPFFFATFVYVINPIKGKVQFNLYPYQKSVLFQFLKNRFNIVLKFRQAGLTELISLYCLWLTLYQDNKKIQIISIKDQVAKKVLKKIKFMYKNLPDHLKTPIVNGRPGELGTTCITGDTLIFGKKSMFRIDSIAPKKVGISDVSNSDIKVFTHKERYQKVLRVFNKGKLETWEISDKYGNILKCTPDHRLYTTKGWKSVREIIDKQLSIITYKLEPNIKLEDSKKTFPPETEEIRPTKYPGYYISNLGRVFSSKKKIGKGQGRKYVNFNSPLKEMAVRKSTNGQYYRVKFKLGKGKQSFCSVHRLVTETFIGNIPDGYVVDHINNCKIDNHVNNLQIVTASENVIKGLKYDHSVHTSNRRSKSLSIKLIGKIREKYDLYGKHYGVATRIQSELKRQVSVEVVSRVGRKSVHKHIDVSKITIVKKSLETIYDLEVEKDHSYVTSTGYINHNSEMIFSNGSFIESLPASENAGRSEALTLLVIDEAAFVPWANTIWSSAAPALSTGGQAIVNSTPFGLGGFFHSQWQDAILGSNNLNPIRLYWQMHPERDENWYMDMARALGPKRTAQEIDGDFLSSGNTVFDLVDIKAIEEMLSEYPALRSRLNGQLREFGNPEKGKEYFIGADIATGRATDYSSFTLMDRDGEEWAVYKGRMSTSRFGKILAETGKKWNFASLAPETNDIGLSITSYLQDEGYPNLYYSQKMLRKKGERKPAIEQIPGWLTTSKNRSLIIDGLEKDIRENNVIIKDPFFPSEAYTFIYDAANRPVAMGKHKNNSSVDVDIEGDTYSDDCIFGKAIANHIRKKTQREIIILPH